MSKTRRQGGLHNADLPIPGESDGFHGVARVSTDLTRFLERATNEDPMVVQAGVWALTDNYSKYEVQAKLRRSSGRWGDTTSAISDEDVARAKQILSELKIYSRL